MPDLPQTIYSSNPFNSSNSLKQLFLKIFHILRENTCARVSFVTNLQLPATLLKRLCHRCFLVIFWKFYDHLFYRTPPNNCFCTVIVPCLHFHTKQEVRKYYQENVHQTIQKGLIGENAKMTCNYQSPAAICSSGFTACWWRQLNY